MAFYTSFNCCIYYIEALLLPPQLFTLSPIKCTHEHCSFDSPLESFPGQMMEHSGGGGVGGGGRDKVNKSRIRDSRRLEPMHSINIVHTQ